MKNLIEKECRRCKKIIHIFKSLKDIKKYCSRKCYHLDLKSSNVYKIGREKFSKVNLGKQFTKKRLKAHRKAMAGRKISEKGKKNMAVSRKRYLMNNPMPSGEMARHYKNGKTITNGYVSILNPKHPYARKSGYIFEHRLVMENKIGRHLNPEERVHHINGIKDDNRPENLEYCVNETFHQKNFHSKK